MEKDKTYSVEVQNMLNALSQGRLTTDERFDQIFSKATRQLSSRHWTPLAVAVWAARLLDHGSEEDNSVLDVGCGPGKFCFIAALTTQSRYYGIEQRQNFVEEALRIKSLYAIDTANFIHGNMIDLDWTQFSSFYLFNPFLENITGLARIDKNVPLSLEHFNDYVSIVGDKLSTQPRGTRVVTYHGYGGVFPSDYLLTQKKAIGSNYLELWIKK